MELRQKTNNELFFLYEGELAFHNRSTRGIHEAKRVLNHFRYFLGEFPPTPELAKSFLSQFKGRKLTTIARYAAILKVFFKWYGEELDINIKVPKILPSYVERADIDKLLEAVQSKRSHLKTINRDLLLIDLAIHTGLRRSELATLRVGDIDTERQVLVVRQGKGAKDRIIPLSKISTDKLAKYIENMNKENSLFGLTPASISGKIRIFANKAGVDIHTHSLRDYFATSLSEKGATIREIQSLLGHANLAHTERYTLHTDKHLKKAIELIDQESVDGNTSEGKTTKQVKSMNRPLVLIQAITKPSNGNAVETMENEYYSHFVIYNDGNSSATQVRIELFDGQNRFLEGYTEAVLRAEKEIIYKPILSNLDQSYEIFCKYRVAGEVLWSTTSLPFRIKKASKKGELYEISGDLEFQFDLE